MPEFLNLLPPAQALERLLSHLPLSTRVEEIDSAAALGRVTAQPVVAAQPLPGFRRATVDGYALQAAATFGANELLPAYLELVGEVAMGSAPTIQTSVAQCALIHTGGMLPAGADCSGDAGAYSGSAPW